MFIVLALSLHSCTTAHAIRLQPTHVRLAVLFFFEGTMGAMDRPAAKPHILCYSVYIIVIFMSDKFMAVPDTISHNSKFIISFNRKLVANAN